MDPFDFNDVTKQQTSMTKARSWQRRFAMQFGGSVCLSARSAPASAIVPTKRPSWQDSRTSLLSALSL